MRTRDTSLVGVRFKHKDRELLQAIADQQHRPLSNLVAAIVLEYLRSHQHKVSVKRVNGNGHEHPKSASAV